MFRIIKEGISKCNLEGSLIVNTQYKSDTHRYDGCCDGAMSMKSDTQTLPDNLEFLEKYLEINQT